MPSSERPRAAQSGFRGAAGVPNAPRPCNGAISGAGVKSCRVRISVRAVGALSGVWRWKETVGVAGLVGGLAASKLIIFAPLLTAARDTTWTTHRHCAGSVTVQRPTKNAAHAASWQRFRRNE